VSTYITRLETSYGLRVAVKDLIDMAGLPTTNGSRVIARQGQPAASDAACLAGTRAAEAAGTVTITGKTNLHELAFGVTGINPWFGTPINPLDASLAPGGSSSGSAVAVGSADADIAFGSDTGGSIRIPAACCGVVGLKTSRGRVELEGVLALAPSLDTIGPMAQTVSLAARGMALLEPGFLPAAAAAARVGRIRLPAEARIDDAIDRALAKAGLQVVDVEVPDWNAATAAAMTVLGAEAWHTHADLWRRHARELSPDVGARLEQVSAITASEVAAAWDQARVWNDQLNDVFTRVAVLALPTLAAAPPRLEDAARLTEIRYVAPFNLAGLPALALPVPTAHGLPASLQLVGPGGSEELLLTTGSLVEAG
jgi:amidase